MQLLRLFGALAASLSVAEASWAKNLNYRSPSEHHPGLGIAVHKVVKRNNPVTTYGASNLNFTHGVASGDPYPDSVILWTRVAPMFDNDHSNASVTGYRPLYGHENYANVSTGPVCVQYKVAEDKNLQNVVNSGQVYTSSDVDYTVKVEATGLQPYTQYYYQFNVCGSDKVSQLGRTKTTPNPGDPLASVGLAVYSCSNYPFGYFNAYGNPVRKDSVDYVLHLGDYIYEYANGDYGEGQTIDRIPLPDNTIFTLYDYRLRLATYRNDPDLQASHGTFPWIPVWDDHEVADNTWKASSSELNNTEESFVQDGGVSVDQRKMNAVRAYFEWMPIRQVEMDDNLRIWRSFSIGSLLDLIMLDTRQYDRSITDLYWNTDYIHDISQDTGRSMMGSRQENWFFNSLSESANRGATWRVIGSQTVFSRINESIAFGNVNPLDYDAWDGYQSNRNRTLNHLYSNNIGNNIMISGDSHASWVSDLVWLDDHPYDNTTGVGSIGVEFAGSAVSSPCPYGANISLAQANQASRWLTDANRELQWQDLYYRGYFELHLTTTQVNAQYFGMPTIVQRNPNEISLANFTVQAGANRLQRPIAGGIAESGSLKGGVVQQTNLTHNTENNTYFISHDNLEVL
ncbi:MAG: hypothetical protein M1820_008606 [Bogoriella megaspora]|nr:MAG: hypothetical protein M1820_008606 [Bogoriella megaspora]